MYLDENDCIQFTPCDTALCFLDREMDALEQLGRTFQEAKDLTDEMARELNRLVRFPPNNFG